METWVISTPGRRAKLNEICRDLDCLVIQAFAVKMRVDLLDAVGAASCEGSAPIILDTVALREADVLAALEEIQLVDAARRIILVIPADATEEHVTAHFATSIGVRVVIREDDQFIPDLRSALPHPYLSETWMDFSEDDPRKKQQTKRKLFGRKKKETEKTKDKSEQIGDTQNTQRKKPKYSAFRYAIAENLQTILVSLFLTIAASVTYFAMAQKGLTLAELGSYFNHVLIKPIAQFFGSKS